MGGGGKAGERRGEVSRESLAGAPSATSSAPPALNAAARRHNSVEALFAARSSAVLAHDRSGFLALVDPTATAFAERQGRLYDELAKVPFASWSYDVIGEAAGLSTARKRALPGGSWIVRVTLQYTYAGATSPVNREQFFTLVPDGAGWLLAEDTDGSFSDLRTQRDIWDLGAITVAVGRRSLVIGTQETQRLLRYARAADRAVREVNEVWRPAWSRRPVVIVPQTQADMATVIDSDGKGLDQIAAVTTGHSQSGPTRGDRVVINPQAWSQLSSDGRHVVMTHEVTHLATRANTYRALPMWLSEGFSDYVAYGAVDVSERVVAQDLLRLVRDGDLPSSLPADQDFDSRRGDLGPAYEGAWLACRLIAEKYGEGKLVDLYLTLGDTTPSTVEADLRDVLGISEAELTDQWQSYLREIASR
jgi:hypothetical protein